jgi:hypothetical protein
MLGNNEKEKWGVRIWYKIARGIAIVIGVFSLIVSILLIAHYLQLNAVDPLNSTALTSLQKKMAETPEDAELKEELRSIDLLARRAYFIRRWQIRTGGFMLFGGVVMFLVCLKIMNELHPRLPEPGAYNEASNTWHSKRLARRLIIAGGILLLLVSLIVAIFYKSELFGKVQTAEKKYSERVRRSPIRSF